MKSRIIAVGVIKKDNAYLIGRKPKDRPPYPNTWHILGGGINVGEETLDEALKREIKEEAGIEIKDIQHVSFDEDTTVSKDGEPVYYIFLDFTAAYVSGDLKPGDDIIEVTWVEKSQLSTINFNPPTLKLFKKLGLL